MWLIPRVSTIFLGSKNDISTGFALCAVLDGVVTQTYKATLNLNNSIFKVQLMAIREAKPSHGL